MLTSSKTSKILHIQIQTISDALQAKQGNYGNMANWVLCADMQY